MSHTHRVCTFAWLFLFILLLTSSAMGAPADLPKLSIGISQSQNSQDIAMSLRIILFLSVLSLAPAIIMILTSFTRIIIVLAFVRQAIGTQQIPPNQILISFALFLTFVTMTPVITDIHQNAYKPMMENKISQQEALKKTMKPLREFMFKQTRKKDIALLMEASRLPQPRSKDDVPTMVLIPSFVLSELKTGFEMGFALFIAFIIIDMVVASILMSLGMMMIPPMMVSLPLKIMIFVMADGWHLVAKSLIQSLR